MQQLNLGILSRYIMNLVFKLQFYKWIQILYVTLKFKRISFGYQIKAFIYHLFRICSYEYIKIKFNLFRLNFYYYYSRLKKRLKNYLKKK